jgi:DNA replication ATP-dependent helicase Dna2
LIDGGGILKSLNKPQQRAVLAALASKDYSLLKGLPGTGKTQTLVALIRLFLLLKKSILITSHTHSAVDNLLVRLMEHQVKFLRLGSQDRIKSCLTESSEKFLTANCKSPEELHQVYKQYVSCDARTWFEVEEFNF